jgi:tRNA A-37 threonylcarbamoyl transferase component Bud32
MVDDALIGRQIDEYRLVSLLGQGGMARVYLGLDTRLQRHVAIKIVETPWQNDAHYVERLRREAQAVAQLDHRHIVRVYHYGESGDLFYLAMQYIEGTDLSYILHSYRQEESWLPAAEAGRIVRELGSALDYAHSRGVIHRDVKPSNVMLDQDGRVVLTDFGLALIVEQGTQAEAFGTPHYMAPEQVLSSAAAGPASDLYSLGVIIYSMFAGRLPFTAEEPMDVALMQVNDAPPPPRQWRPALSPAIETVILKALAKEPADRYDSGAALAAALTEAIKVAAIAPPTAPSLSIPQRVTLAFANRPLAPAAVAAAGNPAEAWPEAPAEGIVNPPLAPPERRTRPLLYAGGGLAGLLLLCLLVTAVAAWIGQLGNERAVKGAATETIMAPGAGIPSTPTLMATLPPTEATATPLPSPSAPPEATAVPVTGYELLLATRGDDSLFVVNRSDWALPLAPLSVGNEQGQIQGEEWGLAALLPGDCVTAWKDSGRPRQPDVECNQVGERLQRSGRERFWKESFSVYYQGQEVGQCRKNDRACIVTIQR